MTALNSTTQTTILIERHIATSSRVLRCNARSGLRLQWRPKLVSCALLLSHETLCQHVYVDKTQGENLWNKLRYQKQKGKRYASWTYRRGQIPNRRPLSERPAYLAGHNQIGIGNAAPSLVPTTTTSSSRRLCESAGMRSPPRSQASRLTWCDRLSLARKPFGAKVKTQTSGNGKQFCGHSMVEEALKIAGYFDVPLLSLAHGTNLDLEFCQNYNDLLSQYVPMKL